MRLFPILICLLILPSVHADEKSRPVDCRFLWFDPVTPPPALLHTLEDGAQRRAEIRERTLSPVVRCFTEDNSIRFMTEADRKLAAIAHVPAGVTDAILVFFPGAATPDSPRWRVLVIDSADDNFPHGGAFVVNLSNHDIRFMIGEHRVQLRPGTSDGVERPEQRDDFNMAPTLVQFQHDGRWRTANESRARFIPNLRYLILAYVDPASGRPRISTFKDAIPAGMPAAG